MVVAQLQYQGSEQPPAQTESPQLEARVLGACLLHQSVPAELLGVLDVACFTSHHRLIWQALKKARGNLALVLDALEPHQIHAAQLGRLIDDETAHDPAGPIVRGWAEKLHHYKRVRLLRGGAHRVLGLVEAGRFGDAQAELAQAGREMAHTSRRSEWTPAGDLLAEAVDLERRVLLGQSKGLHTRANRLINDQLNQGLGGGFVAGQLGVVAGRPGRYKTSYTLQVMVDLLEHHPDLEVAFYSMEMTAVGLVRKVAQALARKRYLAHADIKDAAHPPKFDRGRFAVALSQVAGGTLAERLSRLHVNESSGWTIDQLLADADALLDRRPGVKLLVLDYLQFMDPGVEAQFARVGYGDIAKGLARHCRHQGHSWIALSQLTRAAETRPPALSDLKESGDIEQNAAWVLGLHMPNVARPGQIELRVLKNREGPGGGSALLEREPAGRLAFKGFGEWETATPAQKGQS